jgi:short-subunit dehydrogenase
LNPEPANLRTANPRALCRKTAVIIGASSGIGRALAVALSLDGYRLGVAARRTDLLAQLREELAGRWRLIAWLMRLMPDALYARI